MMDAKGKLKNLKDAWERQLVSADISPSRAENIVRLAELNGLFDAAKDAFAREHD